MSHPPVENHLISSADVAYLGSTPIRTGRSWNSNGSLPSRTITCRRAGRRACKGEQRTVGGGMQAGKAAAIREVGGSRASARQRVGGLQAVSRAPQTPTLGSNTRGAHPAQQVTSLPHPPAQTHTHPPSPAQPTKPTRPTLGSNTRGTSSSSMWLAVSAQSCIMTGCFRGTGMLRTTRPAGSSQPYQPAGGRQAHGAANQVRQDWQAGRPAGRGAYRAAAGTLRRAAYCCPDAPAGSAGVVCRQTGRQAGVSHSGAPFPRCTQSRRARRFPDPAWGGR
jgi:hypothetical protein